MKIFTVDKIRKADEYTIRHEPISSIDLMERASQQLADWVLAHYSKKYQLFFVLGKGNNAGDGLALARILSTYGYHCYVYLAFGNKGSEDFEQNLKRLTYGEYLTLIDSEDSFIELAQKSNNILWIDALMGSGLTRPIDRNNKLGQLLTRINIEVGDKLAIDVPSGLFIDQPTEGIVFKADFTLSFEFPKLAFMMPENHAFVGEWKILPIGLDKNFIEDTPSAYFFTDNIKLPEVSTFAHKGDRGRCIVIAGGYSRMGAAILAAKACLNSGVGLLSLQACHHCVEIVQNAVPEALIKVDQNEYELGDYLDYNEQDVLAFGPAVGFADKTKKLFEQILLHFKGQLILDADAITMLSQDKSLLDKLPVGTILTPHIGEFERLIGKQDNHFDRIKALSQFSKKYKCVVVLKGKFSAIADQKGQIHFNSTGNKGMAKGGSGDVLTGIIAGIFPVMKDAMHAAISGVYLHDMAGDISKEQQGDLAMTATDLIENLHSAQKKLVQIQ